MDNLKKKSSENIEVYKIRLCDNKQNYGLTWQQITDLINKELGKNFSDSVYRKWYYAFQDGRKYTLENLVDDDKVKKQLDKIEKEKIKIRTDKIEINRIKRESARIEMFEDRMLESISNRKDIDIPTIQIPIKDNKKDGVLTITDIHYGKQLHVKGLMGETLNKYNSKVFEQRMWQLLNETLHIVNKEELDHLNVFNLSDSIDGILRMSQIKSLEMGIVDSVIGFAEFMTLWLNELSKHIRVDYYSSQGNHNEIRPLGSKAGEFPHENTERLVTWYVKNSLKENPNIVVHHNNAFNYVNIVGVNVLALHGQHEKNLGKSIQDYMLAYSKPIDLLLSGHLHSSHSKTIGMTQDMNIEFIQSPSICGIDEYSMKLKKTAKAGSKLLLLEENKGNTISYNIVLN